MDFYNRESDSSDDYQQLNTVDRVFDHLFSLYYARLCYFAYQIVKDKEIARDLVQDAFVKCLHLSHYRGNELAAKDFLYTTVRNAGLNALRHRKVIENHLSLQDPSPVEENNIIHSIVKAEVIAEIYAAIASLPASCQRISRMAYLDGLKNSEIAEALNLSINTVKTQKQRALQLLRLKLTPDKFLIFLFLFNVHHLPH